MKRKYLADRYFNQGRTVVTERASGAAYRFPELIDADEIGRAYPIYPGRSFGEGIVEFLRHALHRR